MQPSVQPRLTCPGRGRCVGALRPPPPVVAPLVPRCALLPAATPRDVLSALGMPLRPIRRKPKGPECAKSTATFELGRYGVVRKAGSTDPAKPHHAGGGGGKEREARNERSSDWPQGGRRPP